MFSLILLPSSSRPFGLIKEVNYLHNVKIKTDKNGDSRL